MDLAAEIIDLAGQVPPGRVATFADIADGLGDPRAAMAVFRILRESSAPGLHRIVRASADVAFPGAAGRPPRGGPAGARRRGPDPGRRRRRGVARPAGPRP